MSLEPQGPGAVPPGGPDVVRELRGATHRQAQGVPGVLAVLAVTMLAAIAMFAFVVLDYQFDQDPHRIVKVGLGLAALGSIVAVPSFGLLVFPVVSPFLPWVPPTPIPGLNALNVLLFSIFGTFVFGRVMRRERVFRRGRLSGTLGLLLLVCTLSIFRGAAFPTGYTYDAAATGLVLFRSATTFAPYFIVLAMVEGETMRRRVAWAVVLGLLAESLVTIAYGRNGAGGRAIGSIGQANELGGYLALFTVGALAMLAGTRSWFARVVLAGTFVAGTMATLYSVSRGSLLALVAGILVVGWRTSKLFALVLVVGLALSPLWLPDYVMDRIKGSQVEVEGSDEVALDMAAEARVETWRSILEVVEHHPLDGVGFGGLAYVLPDVGSELGLEEVKDSSHNTFLRMLSEMGAFGLVLFIVLLARVWLLADRLVRRARSRFDRALGVFLCGSVTAMAVSCAFGDRFFNVVLASSFWIVCGLVEDAVLDTESPPPAPPVVARPALGLAR